MWRISDMWRILDFLLYPIHTRGGIPCDSRHLVKRPCPSVTIRGLYATLWNSGETSIYLCSPYTTCSVKATPNLGRYKASLEAFPPL